MYIRFCMYITHFHVNTKSIQVLKKAVEPIFVILGVGDFLGHRKNKPQKEKIDKFGFIKNFLNCLLKDTIKQKTKRQATGIKYRKTHLIKEVYQYYIKKSYNSVKGR